MGYNQLGTVHTSAKHILSGIHQEVQDKHRKFQTIIKRWKRRYINNSVITKRLPSFTRQKRTWSRLDINSFTMLDTRTLSSWHKKPWVTYEIKSQKKICQLWDVKLHLKKQPWGCAHIKRDFQDMLSSAVHSEFSDHWQWTFALSFLTTIYLNWAIPALRI